MYDAKGKLTRSGAQQAIAEGGSVLIDGKLYVNAANLPGEADFAKGDQLAENAARENLIRQQQAISEQLAKLGQSPTPTPAVASDEPVKADEDDHASKAKHAPAKHDAKK